ncbi:hypothetical protein [Pelagicoccus mobilis]|uniref:Uncharacterized protein n=1 Tax=Pelagicoccus mobilis TaxID=415221 RepID=A0A934RX97_9BACT|nr:hypothetical protein [Pelagicoccus mobilis]MBK1877155.1 hypothetical protein [Pelagicoccus mobilis]
MGNYESDANPNEEWEDSWETGYNEFSWEQYLQAEGQEVTKYQAIYSKLIRSANRLDEVALYMGWQPNADNQDPERPQEESPKATHPYTLHRHPLFVSSKALHGWLIEQWGRRISLAPEAVDASSALAYQSTLTESDYYGLLAVTALDIDDFALAIAYFKRGMVSLNKALGMLSDFDSLQIEAVSLYAKHARIRLFDIREIWLRVTSDCRATIARGSEED